jgi:hypothetical protein
MNTILALLALAALEYIGAIVIVCCFLRICKKPAPKPTPVRLDTAWPNTSYYEWACAIAGGKYVGIQEVEGGDNLVLFNSLKTGSTLAVKEKDFYTATAYDRCRQHDLQWSFNKSRVGKERAKL